jgi:hypothetical protein
MSLQPISSLGLLYALPPGFSVFDFVFASSMPSNATESSLTPSSQLLLSFRPFFCWESFVVGIYLFTTFLHSDHMRCPL